MVKIKMIGLYVMAVFYTLAGINHFINPSGYLRLIPEYLPYPVVLNIFAGIFEVAFGLSLFFPNSRRWAAWGIILMLIAFIPVHVYFIQLDSCIPNGICLAPWTGWFRLIIIHPFLLAWSYLYTRN